jgi:hypothetical protein
MTVERKSRTRGGNIYIHSYIVWTEEDECVFQRQTHELVVQFEEWAKGICPDGWWWLLVTLMIITLSFP